jgi:hypothetical protein
MSRIVRLSLTLLFAVMMVIATASAGLAFEPPGNSGLTGFDFPAITKGPFEVHVTEEGPPYCHPTIPNGGPWNAVSIGPFTGPLDFGDPAIAPECEDLNE